MLLFSWPLSQMPCRKSETHSLGNLACLRSITPVCYEIASFGYCLCMVIITTIITISFKYQFRISRIKYQASSIKYQVSRPRSRSLLIGIEVMIFIVSMGKYTWQWIAQGAHVIFFSSTLPGCCTGHPQLRPIDPSQIDW